MLTHECFIESTEAPSETCLHLELLSDKNQLL